MLMSKGAFETSEYLFSIKAGLKRQSSDTAIKSLDDSSGDLNETTSSLERTDSSLGR